MANNTAETKAVETKTAATAGVVTATDTPAPKVKLTASEIAAKLNHEELVKLRAENAALQAAKVTPKPETPAAPAFDLEKAMLKVNPAMRVFVAGELDRSPDAAARFAELEKSIPNFSKADSLMASAPALDVEIKKKLANESQALDPLANLKEKLGKLNDTQQNMLNNELRGYLGGIQESVSRTLTRFKTSPRGGTIRTRIRR